MFFLERCKIYLYSKYKLDKLNKYQCEHYHLGVVLTKACKKPSPEVYTGLGGTNEASSNDGVILYYIIDLIQSNRCVGWEIYYHCTDMVMAD